MQSHFRVRVSKDYLVFASAHFITFRGHQCETLHGHNYRVGVAVEGSVDAECPSSSTSASSSRSRAGSWTRSTTRCCSRPEPEAALPEDGDRVRVDYLGSLYVFPKHDCALLPIRNSTAEMLAQYLGTRVRDELSRGGHTHLTLLELEVEENYGQSATYRETLGD
jgi:6-pyruvoyltetrahydropterin/6-carboxytetrahydropterin synthase